MRNNDTDASSPERRVAMNHRMLRMPGGWEWHLLTDGRAPAAWTPAAVRSEASRTAEARTASTDAAQDGIIRDESAARTWPEAAARSPETAAASAPSTESAAAAAPAAAETAAAEAAAPAVSALSADPAPSAASTQGAASPAAESFAGAPYATADNPAAAGIAFANGLSPTAALHAIKRNLPECADWLDAALERRDASISLTVTPEAGDTMHGTLPLRMSQDEHDISPLHYWLTDNRLVTFQRDLRFMLRLQRPPWEERLVRAGSAPEAFAVMLTSALETLRTGFETFERKLTGLESAAARSGRPIPVEALADLQRELIVWNRHLLTVGEAEAAAAESFGERLTNSEAYRRLQSRLTRIRTLFERHAEAIEALTALSGAAAMQRSGSLLKALTAVIVLPAPAAAVGALWGMNAGGVPLADQPWGFAAVCGGTALISLLLYAWLRRMTRTRPVRNRAGAGRGRRRHAVPSGADARAAAQQTQTAAQQMLTSSRQLHTLGHAQQLHTDTQQLPIHAQQLHPNAQQTVGLPSRSSRRQRR